MGFEHQLNMVMTTMPMTPHMLAHARPWHHVMMMLPEEYQTDLRHRDLTIDQTMPAQNLRQQPRLNLGAASNLARENTVPSKMPLNMSAPRTKCQGSLPNKHAHEHLFLKTLHKH